MLAACFACLGFLSHADQITVGTNLEVIVGFRGAVELTFQSNTGTYYQIQISPDLGSWDNEGYSVKGTGGQMAVLASTRGYRDRAFFRLRDDGDPNNLAPSSGTVGGLYRNLRVTRPSASEVTITADRLSVESDSGAVVTLPSVSVTASTTFSGKNGLDVGVVATSTWYYVWLIYNGTNTAGLLSASPLSPQMPNAYSYKALVSYARTDATSNLINFVHADHDYRWSARLQAASGTVPNNWTPIDLRSMVPPNRQRVVTLAVLTEGWSNGGIAVNIRTRNSDDDAIDTATGVAIANGGVPTWMWNGTEISVMTDPTCQIEYRCSGGGGNADIRVKGFSD